MEKWNSQLEHRQPMEVCFSSATHVWLAVNYKTNITSDE